MNKSVVEVVFKVSARLQHGEDVRLSGNVPALGCNNPDRAISLVTSPSEFPWWQTKEALFIPGDDYSVQYRYCIFSGGRFLRWEGENNTNMRFLKSNKSDQVNYIIDILGCYTCNQATPPSPGNSSTKIITKVSDAHSHKARQLSEWGKRTNVDNRIGSSDGVVIVSYFLPVILQKSVDGVWSATWDDENILSLKLNVRTAWVGSVRYAGAPVSIDDEEAIVAVLSKMSCFPVFIHPTMHHQFYEVFCKQNLWLPMHQIGDVYGPINLSEVGAKSQQDLWYTYSTVNRLFRAKVVEIYQQGDLIWIHGFHLMLLPSFIRRNLHVARIGYFFHTPFPSSEIWKTMTWREELLRGILSADQIGFHLYEYARHFLSSCHRLLGYTSDMNPAGIMTVKVDGREVAITCIHIGVDLERVQRELDNSDMESEIYRWKEKFPRKTIISGIDRLERLKSIPLKLTAIDEFMAENPQWIGKLVFAIIGISAHERGNDYRQTIHDVKLMVQSLNSKYSDENDDCLVYFEEKTEKEMNLAQRLAFFGASDILMSAAARDGLNRIPMEFTLAKQRAGQLCLQNPEGNPLADSSYQGLTILSEFISSARVMRGSLTINPWKIDEAKQAIKFALEMHPTERADRFRRNLEFSTRLTTISWATEVLKDLKGVEKTEDPTATVSMGLGVGFRVMGVRAGFQSLDIAAVNKAYRNARHRLILLDWGGTLVAEHDKNDKLHAYELAQGRVSRGAPSEALKEILESLCADIKNEVFVVSGKELHSVTEAFADVKNLGLAAEHGYYFRWPRDETSSQAVENNRAVPTKAKWQSISPVGDQLWKETAKKMMDLYVQRTNGAYVEQKGNALIWQFRDADLEFGFLQSKELEEHLKDFLSGYNIEVLRGGGVSDGYIEVRPAGLSKGLFLVHALEIMKALDKNVDFVMAIGDDSSDEPMFEEISRLNNASGGDENSNFFSVTVGKKPSAARSYVDDPSAVMDVLQTLSKSALRDKRYFSTVDLPSQALRPNGITPTLSASRRSSVRDPPNIFNSSFGAGGKALSVGNFSNLTANEPSRSSKSVAFHPEISTPISSPAVQSDESPNGFNRTTSSAHLTMSEYFHSISNDEGQDDEGIFF